MGDLASSVLIKNSSYFFVALHTYFSKLNNNMWVYDNYMIMKSLFFFDKCWHAWAIFFTGSKCKFFFYAMLQKMQLYNCDILWRWLLVCWIKAIFGYFLFLLGTWNIFVFFQSKSQLFIFIMSCIQSFPENKKEKILGFLFLNNVRTFKW